MTADRRQIFNMAARSATRLTLDLNTERFLQTGVLREGHSYEIIRAMNLLLLLIILFVLFGGGGYYGYGRGYYGGRHFGGGMGLLLLIIVLVLVFGNGLGLHSRL